jgi:hypothetical protein
VSAAHAEVRLALPAPLDVVVAVLGAIPYPAPAARVRYEAPNLIVSFPEPPDSGRSAH